MSEPTVSKATVKKWKPRVSKEWLEREYIEKRRDCVQIGAELGKDPTTIHGWLRTYGIPTRPRGGATLPHAWKKGQPSAFKGRTHTPENKELFRQQCLADGRVPYLVDGQPYMKGRTGPLSTNWKGGVTPERQEFYRSREWKDACKAVWARADARCERCGLDHREARKTGLPKFHVHHIVSFAVVELRAAVSNLALLCRPCHHFVHGKHNAAREFLGPAEHELSAPTLFDLIGQEAGDGQVAS